MSDFISRVRAEAIIRIVTGLPNAGEILDDFLGEPEPTLNLVPSGEIFRDDVNLYAGGLTFVDLEEDDNFNKVSISESELRDYLNELLGPDVAPAAKSKQQPPIPRGRPKGRNYGAVDAPWLERMREMVDAGAPSPTYAVNQLLKEHRDQIFGASDDAKVDRLVRRFKDAYRE